MTRKWQKCIFRGRERYSLGFGKEKWHYVLDSFILDIYSMCHLVAAAKG